MWLRPIFYKKYNSFDLNNFYHKVQELAKDVLEAHKKRAGNKLKRTLVSGKKVKFTHNF